MKGIDKRCGCRDDTGTKLGARCPLLVRSGHGSYGYRIDLGPGLDARGQFRRRRQEYKGGFTKRRDAERAKAEHLTLLGQGQTQARNELTVGLWLEQWLTGKVNLRATTLRSYASHLRLYLVPHLGHVRLRDLSATHVERMYAAIRADSARRAGQGERATGPATIRRVHATLSSALNTAVKRGLLAHNPAQHVELERSDRPEVTPWQPDELGAFLDAATGDRLGALYELMAFAGLRRGEALGLRWSDVDMQAGVLRVRQTLTDVGGRLVFGKPKTRGSERLIDLDGTTLGALLAHRLAQDSERATWGDAYTYSGLVFTGRTASPSVRSTSLVGCRPSLSATVCRASVCTTSVTAAPHYSWPPAYRSPSSPSGSGTRPCPSPRTPTAICYGAWGVTRPRQLLRWCLAERGDPLVIVRTPRAHRLLSSKASAPR